MALSEPIDAKGQAHLDAINEIGAKCAALFENQPSVVVYNVAGAILAGAMKAAGLSREHAYSCVDAHWDSPDGLACEIRRPS